MYQPAHLVLANSSFASLSRYADPFPDKKIIGEWDNFADVKEWISHKKFIQLKYKSRSVFVPYRTHVMCTIDEITTVPRRLFIPALQ